MDSFLKKTVVNNTNKYCKNLLQQIFLRKMLTDQTVTQATRKKIIPSSSNRTLYHCATGAS